MAQNECPICLNPISGDAYLDVCFHKFCFNCILQWSETLKRHSVTDTTCPLCKTRSSSALHDVDAGSGFFRRHYFNKNASPKTFPMTQSHIIRFKVYSVPLHPDACNLCIEGWKKHGKIPVNSWAKNWVTRELETLLQDDDVGIIVHLVMSLVESFQDPSKANLQWPRYKKAKLSCNYGELHQKFLNTVSDGMRNFLFEKAERFSAELEMFLFAGMSVKGYDEQVCRKVSQSGSSSFEYANSDNVCSTSDDDDKSVVVCDSSSESLYSCLFDADLDDVFH